MIVTVHSPTKSIYINLGNAGGADPLFITVDKGQTRHVDMTSGQIANLKAIMISDKWFADVQVSMPE